MPISSIHDWLAQAGTFSRGFELLRLHGNEEEHGVLFTLLSQTESPFSRRKLEQALRALNESAKPPGIFAQAPRSPAAPQIAITTADIEARAHERSLSDPRGQIQEQLLPKELRPLRRDLDKTWRDLLMTRGMLLRMPDGMELRAIAVKIRDLRRQLKIGWRVIEHYRQTGHVVLINQEQEVTNPVDLLNRRNALRTWLSKRDRGHKVSPPELIAKKRAELDDIDRLLKPNATEVPAQ